jgi:hypothetical protein
MSSKSSKHKSINTHKKKKINKSKSQSHITKTTLSYSSTSNNNINSDTRWLNNVIRGKSLIEITVKQHKWNKFVELIKTNTIEFRSIINNPDNDILFNLFMAEKYRLVWSIHQRHPITWHLKHLSYLIANPIKSVSQTYKSKDIIKTTVGNYYIKIYNDMVKTININGQIKWSKSIINDNNIENTIRNNNMPLMSYALYYENIYVLFDLVNKTEYTIGQPTEYNNGQNTENFLIHFVDYMGNINMAQINHVTSHSDIYLLLIKKIFHRENVNWSFKNSDGHNLLTYIYLNVVNHQNIIMDVQLNLYLYEICKQTLKRIGPNQSDSNGNYPLDIYLRGHSGALPQFYPYIKLLLDHGATKYTLSKKMIPYANLIEDNLHMVVDNYQQYQKNMTNSFKFIIKYIKKNNVFDELIKSRFGTNEQKTLLNIIDFPVNTKKHIESWLFGKFANVNVTISLGNYLTHHLLPTNQLMTYQHYFNLTSEHKELLSNILEFYTSVNGFNKINDIRDKSDDISTTSNLSNDYNTHPLVFKFPIIYQIARKLMNHYPTGTNIISLGESLDKIVFLQSLIQHNEMKHKNYKYHTLPFSGKHNNMSEIDTQNSKLYNKYCKYLYTKGIHPEQIVNNNQKVTIIDFVATGNGMYGFLYMYFTICTQGWTKFKLRKFIKNVNVVVTSAWDNNFKQKIKSAFDVDVFNIRLPYHILGYLYDTNNYRCMKEFKRTQWNELDHVDFEGEHKYLIGENINGCNLVRFYTIYKYHKYLKKIKAETNHKLLHKNTKQHSTKKHSTKKHSTKKHISSLMNLSIV